MFARTEIIGNVGKEPEMRYTSSGTPVTSFSVATTEKWTNASGEKQEKTTWWRVTCWKGLAEITAQYVKKGMQVFVEGKVEAAAYTDKEGNARASLELTASNVKFLGHKGDSSNGESHYDVERERSNTKGTEQDDDMIPF
jgi:single-strand DNA-binding protein